MILRKIGAFMSKMILISLFYWISSVGKRFWHIDKRAFLVHALCNHVYAVDDVWFLRIIKGTIKDFICKNCLVVWKFLLKELASFFAVGTLLGAMTGALIGQETESGFVRGAAVGAISGAVFSIEVFESSLVLWQSDESGIGCVLYLVSSFSLSLQALEVEAMFMSCWKWILTPVCFLYWRFYWI